MVDKEFMSAFEKYFKGCEDIYNKYHEFYGYSENQKDEHEYVIGRRYIKVNIKRRDTEARSVHSFIDMKKGETLGNVMKPASWSAPAKGARGNIFDKNNGLGMMTPHGPGYLR